uniref:GPALPP motifs containing 1 n=1 Tax=Molossus molossus TaxID=27622 RepID=A0A7J8GL90_MOLMO|nr:GPALPP motifs containing 1 [Molossus molossus]
MARDLIGPALPPGFKALGTAEGEERDASPVAGPALPPDYKSSSSESSDSDEDSSLYEEGNQESEEDDTGPPARKQRRNQDDDDDDDDEGFFGPALPPGFKKQDDSPPRPMIGPALPPGFIKSTQKSDKGRDDPGHQVSSCFNSEETNSSDDEDIVGPMPAKGPVNYSITTEFEKRAQRMKEKLTKGDDDSAKPITRESWMTNLEIDQSGQILQLTGKGRPRRHEKQGSHPVSRLKNMSCQEGRNDWLSRCPHTMNQKDQNLLWTFIKKK